MSQYLTEDQLRVFMEVIKSDKELTPVIFTTQPTDLELRIRRAVMADLDKMIACEADEEGYYKNILLRIKDRLNLLWGE